MRKNIRILHIRPSVTCNRKCSYCCSNLTQDAFGKYTEFERVSFGTTGIDFPIPLIDEVLKDYCPETISLCGLGETTLCKNVTEILDHLYEGNFGFHHVDMFTNCTGKPFEWYKNLIDTQVEQKRNFGLMVSVHFEKPSNVPALVKIVDYILENCKGTSVWYTITCVVTSENLADVAEFCNNYPHLMERTTFVWSYIEQEKSYLMDTLPEIAKQKREVVLNPENKLITDCFLDAVEMAICSDYIYVTYTDNDYQVEPVGCYKLGSKTVKLR